MSEPASVASSPFCYLTTTGRVTGAPHRIEIWFALSGGTIYVLSGGREESDWVRNLLASPTVEVELGGRTRISTARLVEPGTPEDALARSLLVDKYQPGYGEDLTAWGRSALPVAIAWDDAVTRP